MIETFIKDFWFLLVAAAGGLVWMVRLEGGMLSNRRDIKRLEEQRKADMEEARGHRDKVDTRLDGIQADVKHIIMMLGQKQDR